MATRSFNEGLTSQLRDCLMAGRMPKPLAQTRPAVPLQSPEGTLTVHPRDMQEEETEETPGRLAPWKVTPLQNRILDAWEGLHAEFQVVADESHAPVNFAPWKYLIQRKADGSVVAKITRFTQEPNGRHRYLMVNDAQRSRALEVMILLASQPPPGGE